MNNLKNKVLSDIEEVYKHGDIKYAIWNYVPRDYWSEPFKNWFPGMYSYDQTDFNYSVCFSMYLNISPVNGTFMSKEFDFYIEKNGYIDSLVVDISTIAPYAIITYGQYKFIDGKNVPVDSYAPFDHEHKKYGDKVKTELEKKGITILDDEILLAKVDPEITLELRTEDVRVYNCLFHDIDGWPK